MIKMDMKKFGTNKVVQEKPWIVCLIWNIFVLAAALGMTIHEGSYYWIILCVLISWPSEDE
jgi:hypothetical protein